MRLEIGSKHIKTKCIQAKFEDIIKRLIHKALNYNTKMREIIRKMRIFKRLRTIKLFYILTNRTIFSNEHKVNLNKLFRSNGQEGDIKL